MERIDEFKTVGHGHLVRLVYDGDKPVMLEEWHPERNGDGMCGHTIDISTDPKFASYMDKDIWFFDPETITVMPSITCTSCHEHGWLEFGVWYNDETHHSTPGDLYRRLGIDPPPSGMQCWVQGPASGRPNRKPGLISRLRRYLSL